jgi:hypothetical protein
VKEKILLFQLEILKSVGKFEADIVLHKEVNRIPQKMIASYLGITPEALSKIRNQKKVET